jgi:hypothetical protein
MVIYSRDHWGLRLVGDTDTPLTDQERARAGERARLRRIRRAAEQRVKLACLRMRSGFGGFGRGRGRHHKIKRWVVKPAFVRLVFIHPPTSQEK